MRRIILEEPISRAAVWSRGCAVFALTVAAVGIVLARKGLDPKAAIAVEGGAIAVAGLALVFALAATVVIWRTGYRGTSQLLAGLVLAVLVLAYPAYLVAAARDVPDLGDATTDPFDPPTFSRKPEALASRQGFSPKAGLLPAEQAIQQHFYPDLQPIVLDMSAADAQAMMKRLVTARHWRIIDETPPLGRFVAGRIDAVAPSPLMGFPADVTIRVKALGVQAKIDIRSASRTPWHRPDSDVRRIQEFAAAIDGESDDGN